MGRVHSGKSKRKSSKQRHKIDRKRREHKRDLRKAAKHLKESGLGPKRSKKLQALTKMALKVSNANQDKEKILNRILKVREDARIEKVARRKRQADGVEEGADGAASAVPAVPLSSARQTLFIPVKYGGNFREQFNRVLSTLVFPTDLESSVDIPAAAYVVTLDSRFAVQSIPWTLLDAIVDAAGTYAGERKVLLLFTLTKIDLISAPAIATQVSLVGDALVKRYGRDILNKNLVCAITPFSTYVEKSCRHFLRVLRQFQYSCSGKSAMPTNLDHKICAFVVGLPNTGRRSLCRHLVTRTNEDGTSSVPMKAAQLQFLRRADDDNDDEDNVSVKFAFPNAKSVTLVQFSEDAELGTELRDVTGGDVFFRSQAFVEKTLEPEAIGVVLFGNVLDKLAIAQAFCQPYAAIQADSKLPKEDQELRASERFLRELGQTVRREKGFHLSPLFVSGAGTMGKTSSSDLTGNVNFTSNQQSSRATLLDVSYSNATPNKLVRIAPLTKQLGKRGRIDPAVKQGDSRNALRLGARTFIRELCQSKNIPWAVMRAAGRVGVTEAQVAKASEIFNVSLCSGVKMGEVPEQKGIDHLNALIAAISATVRDALAFLPNGVVEMDPDCIAPPLHDLDEPVMEEESEGEDEDEEDEDEESDDEEGSDDEEDEDDDDEAAEGDDDDDDEESD